MRRALTYIVVSLALCGPSTAAERRSWNKIRYVGGTVAIKTSPYDWNTKLTLTAQPDSIVVVIAPAKMFAPQQTVRIEPARVVLLSAGPAAWRHVADVAGVQLPARHPSLFGVLQDDGLLAILYETPDGKRQAILLDSLQTWRILQALELLTGKHAEYSP